MGEGQTQGQPSEGLQESKTMRELESYSSVKDFQMCPRYYQNSRLLKLGRKGDSDSLRIGNDWHELWGKYHAGRSLVGLQDPVTRAMLINYPFPRIGGELLIEWPSVFGTWKFTPDLVQKLPTGEAVIWECKTTSSLDLHKVAESHRLSGQVLLYYFLLQEMGINVSHCVLDVAKVPKAKRNKKESDDDFFRRLLSKTDYLRWEVWPTQDELQECMNSLGGSVMAMQQAKLRGFYPKHTANCNFMYGKECHFKKDCGF